VRPVLSTLAVAAALSVPAAASAAPPVLPPGTFDPAAPSSPFPGLQGIGLRGDNAMQGFAFDEEARQLYVLQTVTGDAEKRAGNLWLNRLTYGGKLIDSMRLNGFGHGVSMGVSRHGDERWIFVESKSSSPDGGDGKGTHVSRVVYHGGTTVDDSGAKDATPPGTEGRSPRPTVDPVTGQLVVRYSAGSGVYGFKRVPIEDAVAQRWDRVVDLGTTPSAGEPRPGGGEIVSQGYTVAGTTAYLYYGDSYDHVKKPGDAYVRFVRLRPGKRVTGTIGGMKALPDLPFREPEGIAVQVNPGGAPRLVFGLASDPVTSPDQTKRYANFAFQEGFVADAAPTPTPTPAPAPVPPPAAAPAPALALGPVALRARRIVRARLLRTRRIPIVVGGLDGRAEVRVYARFGSKTRRIYRSSRTVRTAPRVVTLKLSTTQVWRLRRTTGRVRLTISARADGRPTTRRHVTVPRRR
jgi:hypothetical protein